VVVVGQIVILAAEAGQEQQEVMQAGLGEEMVVLG
jgi:hypothetical protein